MTNSSLNKNFPYFTVLLTLTTLLFYSVMAVMSGDVEISYTLFEKFGAPYAIQIYEGQYWGVVVNSLIHAFPLHILVNLAGLWVFGAFLERRIGFQRLFIFGLVSSIFTSLIQLTLSNDAGLGLTGVNYALFGLIFVLAFRNEKYQLKFHLATSLFMFAFLFFSIYMNWTSDWFIGIEAEISGLFWGALIGLSSKIKFISVRWAVMFLPFTLALVTLFYAPWSSMWHCKKGIEFLEKGKIHKAVIQYQKALKIEPTNKIAIENLNQIQVYRLAKLAYKKHKTKDYLAAHRYYLKILAIDKNNYWARTNLRELP
jgi:membrane associated rhomboid family serine protease